MYIFVKDILYRVLSSLKKWNFLDSIKRQAIGLVKILRFSSTDFNSVTQMCNWIPLNLLWNFYQFCFDELFVTISVPYVVREYTKMGLSSIIKNVSLSNWLLIQRRDVTFSEINEKVFRDPTPNSGE